MAYSVELSESAARELSKLDAPQARRILKFPHGRVAKLDDARKIGQALRGSRLGEFWKYRVGDYRIIPKIEDDRLVVLVLASDTAGTSIASASRQAHRYKNLQILGREPSHAKTSGSRLLIPRAGCAARTSNWLGARRGAA